MEGTVTWVLGKVRLFAAILLPVLRSDLPACGVQ